MNLEPRLLRRVLPRLALVALAASAPLGAACSPAAPKGTTPTVSIASASAPPPCVRGRADCDGDPANGCESDLASITTCGGCDQQCADRDACIEGLCRREHPLHVGAGACAIRGGAVHCWGAVPGQRDEFESARAETLPHRIDGMDDVLTVRFNASMASPLCAVRRDGRAVCEGEVPSGLAAETGLRDLAAYGNGVCAVTLTGRLRCGETTLDEVVGVGDATAVVASDDYFWVLLQSGHVLHVEPGERDYSMSRVEGVDDGVDLAAADHALCVLRRSGKVACSAMVFGEVPMPEPAKRRMIEVPGLDDAIAVDVGCAVRASGEAVTWTAPGARPTPIAGVKDARRIGCDGDFGCYERADGAVLCWGSRRSGRLGDGAETTRYAPVEVEGITDAQAVVVGAGGCVLRRNGTVACWGRGWPRTGPRGVPVEQVPGAIGVTALGASWGTVCATGPGKPVLCFDGALPRKSPARYEGLGEVRKALAHGDGPGVALRANGEVVLFDADPDRKATPPALVVLPVRDAVDVALSTSLVCVLRKSGAVACADSRAAFAETPPVASALVEVSGLRDAIQLTGALEVCAVRKTGASVCVEQAPRKGKTLPALTTGRSRLGEQGGLTRIDGRGLSICGIAGGGQVFCRSQMGPAVEGTGLREHSATPLPVKDLRDAVDVSVSDGHACAVLATGRVRCWGSNDGDALGGGESPIAELPVEVKLPAKR